MVFGRVSEDMLGYRIAVCDGTFIYVFGDTHVLVFLVQTLFIIIPHISREGERPGYYGECLDTRKRKAVGQRRVGLGRCFEFNQLVSK